MSPAITPNADHLNELPPLASRYVDVESLPWEPTASEGIEMKVLLSEPETGLLTALFRWQPGATLYKHEHVEIEQTFVLEGSIVDAEGVATKGNFSWRPKGNQHSAHSPDGALVFCCFLKPNRFLEGPAAGKDLMPTSKDQIGG
ncbi:cupin domain-containing protein [Mariniluteicoccus flavus]